MNFYQSQEQDLRQNYTKLFMPFMQSMQNGLLDVSKNVNLHYRFSIPDAAKSIILIMQGRTESAIKYAELCYQLVKSKYGVVIYDHRGQGLSSRPKTNPQIGHIDDYHQYVSDANFIIDNLVKSLNKGALPLNILAHSMGGAIAACCLINQSSSINRAVLSAPMFGIKSPIPRALGLVIAKIGLIKERLLGQNESYFLTQGNFTSEPFLNNPLTTSQIRYDCYKETHVDDTALQLGGISNRWLIEAIRMMDYVTKNIGQIQIPIKLLLAEKEQIVDNSATIRSVDTMHNAKVSVLKGAKHEILFEQDHIRNLAVAEIISFFEQDSANK